MSNYSDIKMKIEQLKELTPTLRSKSDDYNFSVLCIKSCFYKNPSLLFSEQLISETIVDGPNDGGIDALLTDPNSDESNLILVQSKFYQNIRSDEVIEAITKMVRFYNNMISGNYGSMQQKVTKRFLNLNAEVGEESKIIFVLFTSASKGGIRKDKIEKAFRDSMPIANDRFELRVLYADDIIEEIKEAESRRPTVESGKLFIDEANNYLCYGDDAIIANVSAFYIKELYGTHGLNLLARNLRYHVSGSSIDRAIKDSIKNDSDRFWFSFFHELGHIILGHIDYEYDRNMEKEADDFAEESLIPLKEYERFLTKRDFSKKSIIEFAEQIDIDVGVVVGRLQWKKYIQYNQFTELKKTYDLEN